MTSLCRILTLFVLVPTVSLGSLGAALAANGETPFQKTFSFNSSATDSCAPSFTAPSGQRLVVQYIAGAVIVPAGKQLGGTAGTGSPGPNTDEAVVPLIFKPETLGSQDRLNVAQATLFYVEDGVALAVCLQTLPFSGAPFLYFGQLTVIGVLTKK